MQDIYIIFGKILQIIYLASRGISRTKFSILPDDFLLLLYWPKTKHFNFVVEILKHFNYTWKINYIYKI